jgi:hypothetical protein
MNETSIELMKALVKLSRLTVAEIATRSNMLRPNLMEALAGKRGIPAMKQQDLLLTLGIERHYPAPDKIHYWKIGVDLSPLEIAINAFFPNGAEIAGLWREGGKMFDLNRAMDKQQFAIYDDRTLVILMRTSLGVHMPLAKQIGPETVIGLHWKGGKVGSDTMISIPKSIITELENGAYENMNTVRHLIGVIPRVSWDDVLTYIKQHWTTPKDALNDLVEINISLQTNDG